LRAIAESATMRHQMPRASAQVQTAPRHARAPARARRADRPLLKWAGGKRQLLPAFRAFYPDAFRRYHEPFLGSGAVFFDLHASGRLAGHEVRLTDSNADLIACYEAVRDRPAAVVAELAGLAEAHARDGAACYYAVRERFNAARLAAGAGGATPSPAFAAMLIYLNRTGFNGLYRVNQSGAFNVPAGRYARPRIVDEALVRATANALARPGVTLELGSFVHAVVEAGRHDLVYFDPPYAPLSATSGFGAYTMPRFTADDQQRLRDLAIDLSRRGARVMVSNSSAPAVEAWYAEAAGAGAGLALWQVPARRAINSRGGLRGPVRELLLTNLVPRLQDLPEGVSRIA
jgi:DNA adenine methylase